MASSPDPEIKGRLGSLRALWPFIQRQRGLFTCWLLALGASSAATLTLPVAVRRMPSPSRSTRRTFFPTSSSLKFLLMVGDRINGR